MSTASGGPDALFPTSGEQELLSGEKLAKPQAGISEDSYSEGCHSSPRHFLATPLSDSERADRDASGNVSLHVIIDEKVDVQDQKHTLPSPQAVGKSCNLLTAQPSVVVTSHITHRWIGLIVYFHLHLAV